MRCTDARVEHARAAVGELPAGLVEWRALGGIVALAGALVAAGCGTGRSLPPGRPVELGAFVLSPGGLGDAASADEEVSEPGGAEAAEASSRRGGRRTILGAGSVNPPRLIGAAGGEEQASPTAPARRERRASAGDSFVVDALVGQINGRPIFASAFFEPIADELRAKGQAVQTQTAFVQEAGPIIQFALRRRVKDSLYLAEAEASLSPEERQGLRYWLAELQNVTVAQRGGSRAEADRRLRATENRSLEEEVDRQRDEALQLKLIREEIGPRVIVSKYEIEREYQRRYDEFNPPPRTRVDRLVIRRSETDLVASISARLAGGEPIAEIAEELVAEGRARLSELGVFGLEASELSESEQVAELLRPHTVGWEGAGDWTGPVDFPSSVSFFFVGDVQVEPGRPSHDEDVQRILKAELQDRKYREELARFDSRLRQDSIISQEQEMLQTLMEIAVRRYGPR